jgi:nucleoid-associated protein YgaU
MKTRWISAVSISLVLLALGSACSSSKTASEGSEADAESVNSADAGTDTVPPPSVDEASAAPTPENAAAQAGDLAQAPAPDAANGQPDGAPMQDPASISAPGSAGSELSSATAPGAPEAAGSFDSAAASAAAGASASAGSSSHVISGEAEQYTVQPGDTLMKIAFETYGDLYQWHRIYDLNRDRLHDANQIAPGTVLQLEKPSSHVQIERNGDKYLIKHGDTLASISGEVYGDRAQWRKIYQNNRQLIHDPNRIFAGFYLYYTGGQQPPQLGHNGPETGAPQTEDSRVPSSVAPAVEPAPAPPALPPQISAPPAPEAAPPAQ